MEQENKLVVFQEKQIRRTWLNDEWWFSIIDVIGVLTESTNPQNYWYTMKSRLKKEGSEQTLTNCKGLVMVAQDGRNRKTDCANTETMFRLVQSIPSPKAEPFKQWLAKVGYERVQEIENPELAAQRAREYYKELGYNDEWIDQRLQSINIRSQLTDQWKGRGVKEGQEYAILTAEISQATFGLKPSEYKTHKGLKRENLRDHMTNLELIFTQLGEEQTRHETIQKDAQGFEENRAAAIEGGAAAGEALDAFEKRTGRKVVSDQNYKLQIKEAKKQKRLEQKQKREKGE